MKKKVIIIILFSVVALAAAIAIILNFFSYTCNDCGAKVVFQNYTREEGTGENSSLVYVCSNCYHAYCIDNTEFNINDYSHTFNDECYNEYQNVVNEIESSQNADTQNARMLYEQLLTNKTLTSKEKKELTKYIQYFVDNQYIDCKHVCKKLSSFIVNENDPSLLEEGVGAAYFDDNSITFATETEREASLAHELHHSIENEYLDYEEYGWFCEGFTSLVTSEYFNGEGSDNSQTFFIRALAEFVGADVLFQVSAKGDINILISKLIDCGINQNDIDKLFNMFKQLKETESNNSTSTIEERIEVAQFIVDLYCTTNNSSEISDSLYKSIIIFLYQSLDDIEYYYLNSTLKNNDTDIFVSLEELENTYELAKKELD